MRRVFLNILINDTYTLREFNSLGQQICWNTKSELFVKIVLKPE